MRQSRIFQTIAEAEAFKATLPAGSDAVVVVVKNTEDFHLGRTTAQCRILWVKVCFTNNPLPWRR